MADSTSRKVIEYIADTQNVIRNIKLIETANKKAAQTIGKQFGGVTKIIESQFKKLSEKTINIGGEKLNAQISRSSQVVKTLSGNFFRLDEVTRSSAKGVELLSSSVTEVTSKYTKLASTQNKLLGKSSQLATNFKNLGSIQTNFKGQLSGVGKVTKVLSTNLVSSGNNFKKFSSEVQTSSGKIVKLNETVRKTPEGIQSVNRSMVDMTKNSVSLTQNIGRLAKRAALTIPVWFAFRQGISSTVSTLKDGIKNLADFDRALQKLRRNVEGNTANVGANFDSVRKKITEFSIKSGVSTEQVTNAVQRLATVGFDLETSLKAGFGSVKLSTVLFSENANSVNNLARSMNVLVRELENNNDPSQRILENYALIGELWKDNAFTVDELASGMEKFSGTAKALNLTSAQTITLLATLSSQGLNSERAGKLLRTSFLKLTSNLEDVTSVLGVKVNPELDTTFDVFRKITQAIADLRNESGKISPEVSKAISELFGSRSGEPILDIVANIEKVNDTFDRFLDKSPDVAKFNAEFEDVNDSLFKLTERIGNVNKEIGKTFVTGLVGGEDFEESLKSILGTLEGIQTRAQSTGAIFRGFFSAESFGLGGGFTGIIRESIANSIGQGVKEAEGKASESFGRIAKALKGQLEKVDLVEILKDLDSGTLDIGEANIDRFREAIIAQLRDKPVTVGVEPELDEGVTNQLFQKTQDIAKAILSSELKRVKASGALESQALKIEQSLINQLGIQETALDKINRQLNLERAINEEKRLGNTLSSDSVKLFRIARDEGTDIAKQIGSVLSGETDFSSFIRRGGDAVDIFKKQFASIFEQQQAQQFFKGDRVSGIQGLRGGFGVNIAEPALRQPASSFDPGVAIRATRAEQALQGITKQDIRQTNNVTQTFNVQANGNPEEVAEEVAKTFRSSLSNPESPNSQAIKNFVLNI